MAFGDFFSNDFETKEKHPNSKLVTRNYKGDYNKVKAIICEVLRDMGFEIEEVNDQYKEIRAATPRQEMIVSLFSVSYFNQAVDVKVNTNYLISCGRGLKLIVKFYESLDKELMKVEG